MPSTRPELPTSSAETGSTAQRDSHVPVRPSGLRQSFTAASYESLDEAGGQQGNDSPPLSPRSPPANTGSNADVRGYSDLTVAGPSLQMPPIHETPTESTSLLGRSLDFREQAHEGPCNHGTFSPRPASPTGSGAGGLFDSAYAASHTDTESDSGSIGPASIDGVIGGSGGGASEPGRDGKNKRTKSWKRQLTSRIKSKKMSTSSALARQHGVKASALTFLSYYLPVLVWAPEYNWSYFKGDFVAALTVAGMYVPMALSLAANLAHVPPIHGLYSFVFNPLIYALLGSCPSMIVGPEAAGSLLVGTVIKASVDLGRGGDDDDVLHATICGVIAGTAGAMVLAAGVARLGFLDSVLSRPFLRGFISAIGVVIAVDQLIPELGLSHVPGIGHASSVDKMRLIITNLDKVHGLTFAVAGTSFVVIMVCRELKRRLQPRYPGVAYIPDRFLVVVFSAILAYYFEWDKAGVAVLGKVEAASGHLFTFRWPFQPSHITYIRDAMGTSFLIALLGFFESSVAAKSLGGREAFAGIQLSPNRELVALGTANLIGSCFMSLPAFGGYGRSKVNQATGGKSPMASILLAFFTLICILFLLPSFYYLPVCFTRFFFKPFSSILFPI